MTEVRITGPGLADLKRKVKQLDDKKLMRAINKSLQQAAKPLLPIAAAAARDNLPKRGGLAATVAAAKFRISVTQRGVRVVSKGQSVWGSNHGQIRHPVFGNDNAWVMQKIPGGWFDNAMKDHAGDVRPEIVKTIDKFLDEVAKA